VGEAAAGSIFPVACFVRAVWPSRASQVAA
jgi:hypothetical protein